MGETPHWDAKTNSLYYIDLSSNKTHLYRYDFGEGRTYAASIEGEKGPFAGTSFQLRVVKTYSSSESITITKSSNGMENQLQPKLFVLNTQQMRIFRTTEFMTLRPIHTVTYMVVLAV